MPDELPPMGLAFFDFFAMCVDLCIPLLIDEPLEPAPIEPELMEPPLMEPLPEEPEPIEPEPMEPLLEPEPAPPVD